MLKLLKKKKSKVMQKEAYYHRDCKNLILFLCVYFKSWVKIGFRNLKG